MTPQRWLLILLATVVAAFGLRSCLALQLRSPESLLDSAKERLLEEVPDWNGALRELGLGYELAMKRGEPELARRLLLERANTYSQRLALDFTLRDCRLILERLGPDDATLELACRTCIQLEDFEAALEFAELMRSSSPTNEMGLSLVGRVQMGRAEAALAEARIALFEQLADADGSASLELARQVAALEPGSSQYAATLGRLRTALADGALEQAILGHVATATGYSELARAAFLESLELRVSPEALDGLIELLTDAGALEEAVGLGNVALSFPRYQKRWGTVLRTSQGLLRLGRTAEARRVVDANEFTPFHEQPTNDQLGWCQLLFRLENWRRLNIVSDTLPRMRAATERQIEEATFYLGMSLLRQGLWEESITPLKDYASRGEPRIYAGAQAEAWIGIAEAARQTSKPTEERRALNALIRVSPAEASDAAQAALLGAAWLRLSQLQAQEEQVSLVERSLTHAMRYQPQLVTELYPLWEEVGRDRMARRGRTFLTPSGLLRRSEPELTAGPHELLLFAEYHLTPLGGEPLPSRSAHYARRVLGAFPDFLPALDVLGRAHLLDEDPARAAEAIVRQFEVGGPTPALRRRILEVPAEVIPSELLYRWARSEPRSVLLEPFVDQLLERGSSAAALRALDASGTESLDADQLLLRKAQLYARLGAWQQVLELALRLDPAGEAFAEHAGLVLRAAAGVAEGERPEAVRQAVERVLAAPALRDPQLPRALDVLLANGFVDAARDVLLHLDQGNNRWEGAVVTRLALAETLAGRLEEAEEHVARAEAFEDDVATAVARLVLATAAGRFAALAPIAARLAPEALGDGDRERGLLAALRGRTGEALELLGPRADGAPTDALTLLLQRACQAQLGSLPRPAEDAPEAEQLQTTLLSDLLYGFGDLVRDPRETIVLVLAAGDPVWAPWAVQVVRELPARLRLSPWSLLVEARALRSLGSADEARRILRELYAGGVTYAVLELEELLAAEARVPDDPALLAVRSLRAKVFGRGGWSAREAALVQAFQLERAGKQTHALAVLEEAGRADPDDPVLAAHLAAKRAAQGYVSEAVDAYQHVLALGADNAADVLPEYLEALHRAAQDNLISSAAWEAELEALEALSPDDPTLARELAALVLTQFGPGSDEGFRRAWQRLEAFRDRTGNVPIESLRRGEAARWFELYAAYDPDRAAEFAHAELLQTPTSLDLWWLYAEALAERGDLEAALEICGTVGQVVDEPRFARLSSDLELALGLPPEDVLRRLDEQAAREAAERAAGEPAPAAPAATFQRARALLRLAPEQQQQAHALLAELWSARAEHAAEVDVVELGTVYGLALLAPGPLRDPDRALEVVRATLPLCRTLARRDFLRAFAAVAEQGFATQAIPEKKAAARGKPAGGKPAAEVK